MKQFQHNHKRWLWSLSLLLLLILSTLLTGCETGTPHDGTTEITDTADSPVILHELSIEENDRLYMEVGDTLQLHTDAPEAVWDRLTWTASNGFVSVTKDGLLTAQAYGETTVTVSYSILSDSITVIVVEEIPEDSGRPDGTDPDDPSDTSSADTDEAPPAQTDPDTETSTGSDPETAPDSDSESKPVTPPDNETTTEPDSEPETEVIPPTVIIEAERAPAGYKPAGSYQEALDRTQNGELSGYPYVPDQAPIVSEYRPMEDGKYIKNNDPYYLDDNTYVVVDAYGREVFRIYRGGAYISLEEVAAYVWAFGDIPANHSTSKSTKPTASIWGEYLRVNHTKFSGDTSRYPYEPILPRISGCGGDFTYYEMDIGTTGTDCDPSYTAALYNNGSRITRGAARIVYARFDRNGNKIIDPDEKYVFYTYNHYNDFQEYLNYYGGWGEMFGNITGGGTISSKYDYNPTEYVPVVTAPIAARSARILPVLYAKPAVDPVRMEATVLHCDFHRYRDLAA